MINKIRSFLKQSNRGKHLLGGFLVSWGASSPYDAVYAATVSASCLELKDRASRTQSQACLSYAEAQPHLFNLRWMPTTSPDPEATHHSFWVRKLTLPVDHPFWNHQHPGNRWNCKCYLEQADEPANPEVLDEFTPAPPQRGLENNPGKDGHIFNDTHPYFPKSCSQCAFYRKGENNKLTYFLNRKNKDCFSCHYIKMQQAYDEVQKEKDIAPPFVQTYIPYLHGKVFISPYHGKNELEENKRLACFITENFGKKVYLLPRLDPKDPRYAPLRESFLPQGVYEGKNPDFYIGGLIFDGKSMMNVVKTAKKASIIMTF